MALSRARRAPVPLDSAVIAAWVGIVLVGGVLRLMQTVRSDFPLGDGGLFYSAIEAIRLEGILPQTIPYNEGIPFVYPPLGFLLAALPSGLVGTDDRAAHPAADARHRGGGGDALDRVALHRIDACGLPGRRDGARHASRPTTSSWPAEA